MTGFQDFATAEESNRLASAERLGNLASLPDDIEQLYERMTSALPADPNRPIYQHSALWSMQAGVRDEFIHLTLSIMRGHLTPPMRMLRRSIELTAQAWLLHKEPDLVPIWWHAGDDEAANRAAKTAFRVKKLFPKADAGIWPLYAHYASLSRMVHPSVYSVVRRMEMTGDDAKGELAAHYFEVVTEDNSEPGRSLLFACRIELDLFDVFMRIFEAQLGSQHAVIAVNASALRARHAVRVDEWRATSGQPPRT